LNKTHKASTNSAKKFLEVIILFKEFISQMCMNWWHSRICKWPVVSLHACINDIWGHENFKTIAHNIASVTIVAEYIDFITKINNCIYKEKGHTMVCT